MSERDLNVVGPMARSARDLRLLLSVLQDGPLAAKAPPAELKETRIGLWLDEPGFPLDPQVKRVVEAFVEQLSGLGCAVELIRPVDGPAVLEAYRRLLAPLIAQDMPLARRKDLERMRGVARLMMGLGEQRRAWAGQILSYTASHAEWMEADEARARFAHHLRGVLQRHDAIIAPIAPVTAFAHDHAPYGQRTLRLSDGTSIPYASMLSWICTATACGLPATAIPVGLSADGLPVGVQIIGPRGGDGRTLAIAQAIEEALGGFVAPPPLKSARSPSPADR